MRWGGLLALVLCVGATMTHALAQGTGVSDYPSRGITLVMPLAAASAGDVLCRLVASKMATDLGRHIVAENVTGASVSTKCDSRTCIGSTASRPAPSSA